MQPTLLFLVTLAACGTMTDRAGNTCASADALFDGSERWCPQDDAEARCRYLAESVATFEVLCAGVATDREIVLAIVEKEMGCDVAVVVYPEADACLDQLTERSCPLSELPAECDGVVLGG
ncbi:MAG: hypothetical protein EXR71_11725 [Myxococcales bacterium]|nr:hypothetical protein [Myxococcales bacterium]